MRHRILFILLLCCISSVSVANPTRVDSLKSIYRIAKPGTPQRLNALIQLTDIHENTDNDHYTKLLLTEANKQHDVRAQEIAFTSLIRFALNNAQPNSLKLYVAQMKKILPAHKSLYLSEYAHMMTQMIQIGKIDTAACRRYFESNAEMVRNYKEKKLKLNSYQQITALCVAGRGELVYRTVAGINGVTPTIVQNFKDALNIANALPIEESLLFREQILSYFCDLATEKGMMVYARQLVKLEEQKFSLPLFQGRPFADKSKLLRAYAGLASDSTLTKKEAAKYFKLYQGVFNNLTWHDPRMGHMEYYLTLLNYAGMHSDWKNAVTACDSLLKLAFNPEQLNIFRLTRANALKVGKSYREACEAYSDYIQRADSVRDKMQYQALNELQAQVDVNKLELENANLTISRDRTNLAIMIGVIILLTLIIVGTIYFLSKTQKLNNELHRTLKRVDQESKRAQAAEQMKSNFIHIIHSDMKLPLNVADELSRLLIDERVGQSDRQEISDKISESLRRLSTEFENMTIVGDIESQENQFLLESTDIYALTRQSIVRVQESKVNKSPNVTVESTILAGTFIPSNKKYYSALMDCLIQNAVDYTENGAITVDFHETAEAYIIRVKDTGCGIPEAMHEEVFQCFTKVNPYSQGTGIGLYLCRLIVNHLNGTIHIDSSYTDGTCMVVTLRK